MSIRRFVLMGLVVLAAFGGSFALSSARSLAFEGYSALAPTSQFGESGSGDGQFSTPVGVAVSDISGDVYVVDEGNNRVERFDSEGTYLAQFNGSEAPTGQFSQPSSIAVDNTTGAAKGDVYVTDTGHEVVDVFDAEGKYLSQLTGTPTGPKGALEPFVTVMGVAVDTTGNVWVYEGNNREEGVVDEFTSAAVFVKQFFTGFTAFPGSAIVVDSSENVYTVTNERRAVRGFSGAGSELMEVVEAGATGLAVNESSNDLLVDKGEFVAAFDSSGTPLAQPVFGAGLLGSQGIAVNDTAGGTVYASEAQEDKVDVFKFGLLPDVSTGGASGVTPVSVVASGTIKRNGKPTSGFFQYGETEAYGSSTPATSVTGEEEEVTANLAGLQPNKTYHYRLVGSNSTGSNVGGDQTFTTLPVVATVSSPPTASDITRTGVRLAGAVNPENSNTTSYFECGTSEAYGSRIEAQSSSGFGEVSVGPLVINELQPGTLYHCRLVASNQAGTVVGPDGTFTTAPRTPPAVTTGGASGIASTAAAIAATINPRGLGSTYGFEIGTGTGYGSPVGVGALGASTSTEVVTASLQGLIPGTTYHYRITATSSDGTSYGEDHTFTTPSLTNQFALPATPPLIATPAISFPIEARTTTPKPKALTRAQKLAAALRACRKRPKSRRAACGKRARKQYGSEKQGKKK